MSLNKATSNGGGQNLSLGEQFNIKEDDGPIILEMEIVKGGLGLGFCIEGGKGAPGGDRPISVKRLFQG